MKPILSLYWRLCRLAAGPEDVPFSGELLAQGFVFHRALNVGPVLGGMIAIFVLYLTHAALNLLFPEMAGTAS